MSNVPEDLRYTESHEWVALQEDGTVRVGITDYAQQQLGDLVYVELPEVGQNFVSGAECAVVESVKSASDLYMPVSGEIVSVNEELADSPELINQDPYGQGWIFEVQPTDPGELDGLLDADGYRELIEGEAG
ncbi:MAG: glycine cleavage system protein GcvH [Gammaproteobacteria bacterium]|nr:MAG: glycine cleavage system protein GcvH [Gammaproteobacteria bacterium]